jgi:hypothetical protein
VLSQQVTGQARSENAGALHHGPAHRPQLAGPDEQWPVAGRRGRKGLGTQDLPQRGDHGGNMNLAVRVHAQDDLARNERIRTGGGAALSGRHGGSSRVVTCWVDGTGLLGRSEP